MEDFEYVKEKPKVTQICFGSTLPRDTSCLGKYLSPFQTRETAEINPITSPLRYDLSTKSALYDELNKVRSRKGIGFFASDAPRFSRTKYAQIPPPTAYYLGWEPDHRQNKAPFGVQARRDFSTYSFTPGVGRYNTIGKQCRRSRVNANFGIPLVIPAVETYCMPRLQHKCGKCNQLCDKDYWKKDDEHYLCHECWREAKAFPDEDFADTYKEYKKIRNCTFMHRHEGTSAAIRLMPKNKLFKKLRIENYLDLYLDCHEN